MINTITITFNHPQATPPTYKFGDRIAVVQRCQPKSWATGKVIGLQLEEIFKPRWLYIVTLDFPSGFIEEYLEEDLVPESEIPNRQTEWEQYRQLGRKS